MRPRSTLGWQIWALALAFSLTACTIYLGQAYSKGWDTGWHEVADRILR